MKLHGLSAWTQADPATLNYYMQYFSQWLGAPANLLMTVAMAESSYDPTSGAYDDKSSTTGAAGLMQLMPIALQDIHQRWGVSIDPYEPIQAIVGAALVFYLNRIYLKHYAKTNPGWDALIVAYNGGFGMGLKFMRGQAIASESANYLASVGGALGVA
jgi:hypothetical protein